MKNLRTSANHVPYMGNLVKIKGIVKGEGKKGPGQKGVEKYLSRNAIQCIQNDRRPCDLNSESLLMVYYDANKE